MGKAFFYSGWAAVAGMTALLYLSESPGSGSVKTSQGLVNYEVQTGSRIEQNADYESYMDSILGKRVRLDPGSREKISRAGKELGGALMVADYSHRRSRLSAIQRRYGNGITGAAVMSIASEYLDEGVLGILRPDPVHVLLQNGQIQAALALSFTRNLAAGVDEYRQAEKFASEWHDANGRPMTATQVYQDFRNGSLVQTPAGPMRIDRQAPWQSYTDPSEVTSRRSYATERGTTVETYGVSPGISPRQAEQQRTQEWRQQQYDMAARDAGRAAQAGAAAANQIGQAAGQATNQARQALGSALSNIFAPKK